MAQALLTSSNIVQVPIIIVQFGEGGDAATFGLYTKTHSYVSAGGSMYATTKITYPNYVQSLKVKKINGTVNTYSLTISYPVTENDDPDMFNKIFSTIMNSRSVKFTYGDGALPAFVYREEEALITDATYDYDWSGSKITYNITAVSSGVLMTSGTYTFPGYTNKKPSDVIKSLLYNESYGLIDVFYGMRDKAMVEQLGLIPGNDKSCRIEKKVNMTALNYLSYLVSCMSREDESVKSQNKTVQYVMTISDEISGVLNGPYFQIHEVLTSIPRSNSIEYYSLDIGYPSKDYILDFSVSNNQVYTLLYNYAGTVNRSDYVYRIGDDGDTYSIYSPSISNNSENLITTAADKSWWSSVTAFPVTATVKIKGLLRAALLMSYVQLNVYMYGKKMSDSGTYIITEQNDEISASGYQTTLSLTRIEGDDDQTF